MYKEKIGQSIGFYLWIGLVIIKAGGNIGKVYGQEKNITTYNLARMNMLLHGVKDTEFHIRHGDPLRSLDGNSSNKHKARQHTHTLSE